MANPNAAPYNRTIERTVGAVGTAGNDLTSPLLVVPEDGTVTAVSYIPVAAITGANTNSRTISVLDAGADGTGTTAIATLALTSGVNASALAEKTVTLSGTAANLDVTAGDVLAFKSLHVGTGITDPGGVVRITIARR